MKVTEDGFIWQIVSPVVAKELFKTVDVFSLYEDDSESLVIYKKEIKSNGVYGLPVGFMKAKDVVKIINNIK